MRKGFKVFVAVVVIAVFSGLLYAGQSGEEAAKKLMDGNARFVTGQQAAKDIGDSRRKELAKGQQPFAVVLSCSDSRVAPEHLFDQGLGDIFVVRTAGNIVDKIDIGSIEYGVEHLHAPVLMILGHQYCGAVTAAVNSYGKPSKHEKHGAHDSIGEIIRKIMPAVKKVSSTSSKDELVDNAIKQNVRNVYKEILTKSPVVKELVHEKKLQVVLAEYYLDSGKVVIIDADAK